jgi:hypothetical protein
MLVLAGLPDRRDLLEVGQHVLDRSRPDVVADPAGRNVNDSDRSLGEIQLGKHAELIGEHRAANDGVEERGVHRIHRVFEDLQPVARVEILLAGHHSKAGPDKAVIGRKRRLLLWRTEIGEQDAVRLVDRIGAVEQPIFQGAVGWLSGCIEDRPVHVEQPAVITAADPLVADEPEFQGCAAVRAVQLEQSGGSTAVAEGDQFLAEDFQPHRQVLQIVGVADRLPEAAHIFAARRVGADMGEFAVLSRHVAMMIAAVTRF